MREESAEDRNGYKKATDINSVKTLLSGLASGDRDSFSSLYERYYSLIRKNAQSFANSCGADIQELEQEATIALYHAALSYSDTKNVTFGLYAKVCIRNALVSFTRKQDTLTTQTDVDAALWVGETLENEWLQKNLYHDILRELSRTISKTDFCVFQLYLSGCTYSKIAQQCSLHGKQVDNILYRVKKQLKHIAVLYGV